MLQFILCSSIFTIVVKPLNIFYQICFCSFFFFFSNFAIAVKFEYSVYKPYHKAAIVCQSVLYFEIGDHWGDQYCQIVVVLPCVYTFGTAAFSRKFLLQPSSCPCTPSGSRFAIVVVLPCVYTFATAAFGRKFLLQPSNCLCTPSGSHFRCFT